MIILFLPQSSLTTNRISDKEPSTTGVRFVVGAALVKVGGFFMSVKTDIGPFAIVPLWLSKSASNSALRLYALVSAKYANKESQAWPSYKTISEDLGCSKSSVVRDIIELKKLGALTIENRNRPNGSPTSNVYTLITSKPEADIEAKLERGAKSMQTKKLEHEAMLGRIAMIGGLTDNL